MNRTGGIKGTPLHFNVLDDQTQPAVAVQLLQQLLPSKPAVVLGSSLVAQSQAALHGFYDVGLDVPVFTSAANYVRFTSGDQHGLRISGLLMLRSDPDRPGRAVVATFLA